MDLRERRVSEIMRREVVTVTAQEKLDLTQDIMNLGRVRHLPVLDEDQHVIGIISHRDLLAAAMTKVLDFDPSSRRAFLRSVDVGEVMAKDVATVAPDTKLAEVARIFVQRKVGCVPVVSPRGELLGLVTETDLIAAAFLDDSKNEAGESDTGRVIEVSEKADFEGWMKRELDDLRRIRDELRVQAHLGKAEMRERWEALERTFDTLESKAKRKSHAAKEPLRQLEQDLRKLAADLRDGYRQIRDAI
jgi:CBS domain-containing membrane protein